MSFIYRIVTTAVFAGCLCLHGLAQAQTIWESNPIGFTKDNYADWTDPANQDCVMDDTRLTRQDIEGLFNIVREPNFDSFESPIDTEWAFHDLDGNSSNEADITASNYLNLTFDVFAYALELAVGNNILSRPGVVHLISDDVYLNIEFDGWTKGINGGGGFSYTRTSPGTQDPIRITCSRYASIQTAYDASDEDDIVEARAVTLTEDLFIDRNVTVTLDGGLSNDFTTVTGSTILVGNMTISDGIVAISDYVISN